MVDLKIAVNGRVHTSLVPERFDELSREQFFAVCRRMLRASQEKKPQPDFFPVLLGLDAKLWESLAPEQRHPLASLLAFTDTPAPKMSGLVVPFIEAGGQKLIGYQPTFSNTTWQEFVYADGFALAGRYREAAAVLYRPQRNPYDGETDRRIPFSIYGTDTRLALFDAVPEEVLLAVILNYNALRRTHLEEKYPRIFTRGGGSSGGGGAFSWVRIHRDLMGDQFFDEKKFFESNVHVILGRLDREIRRERRC